jgi:hypothetical protein
MSSATKTIMDILRVLLAAGGAYIMYYGWKTIGKNYPSDYPLIVGVVSFVILLFLLKGFAKDGGGGG